MDMKLGVKINYQIFGIGDSQPPLMKNNYRNPTGPYYQHSTKLKSFLSSKILKENDLILHNQNTPTDIATNNKILP